MTALTDIRGERSFFRKTRGNAIVKLVREQYVRNDIPCMAECCSSCQQLIGNTMHQAYLSAEADHYVIPDMSIVMRYLEILEHEEFTGIILSQTIVTSLQQHDKLRTYRKLRQIINDTRHNSVVFYNEIFADTRIARLPGETVTKRDWRALCSMANWYSRHLGKPIVLLSEVFHQSDYDASSSSPHNLVSVRTMKQYIDQYWPDHSLLQSLVHVLAEAVLEDDLERIKMSSNKNKSEPAVSGYTEYKAMEELEAGIKSSRYFSGILKCRGTKDSGYVNGGSQLDKDILIVGPENVNRAVHGDLVVVELLSENNWTTAPNTIAYGGGSAEDEYEEMRLTTNTQSMRPTGRVIGILNRNWRSYVATIQEDTPEGGSFHLAIPLDSAIPKIRIRHHDVKMIQNQRIVVRIDSWPVSSQYPNGHYVRSLGPIHQLDTEVSAILVEHGISVSQASQGFSEASLKEMPLDEPGRPWQPEEKELARRKDLRSLTVFSIDPPNCQDIDDALSARDLGNGLIELGVHIADVSYFVKENSLTDLEARARGTTVYLADRRFDMLPSVLSERVCSLRENVDRYAVSVLWTMDSKTFEVKNTWFGRSIIRSSCEMEYDQAQQLLDGEPVATNLSRELGNKLRPSIEKLAAILRAMRQNRLSKGALELESSEVKFKITENHKITDIIPKDTKEIHGLVAEAMIMANAYVGKRVYDGFKDAAILRRHPPPNSGQFDMLVKAAESRGFSIDFSSNLALSKSLQHIADKCHDDPEIARLMKTMATIAMNEAGYISSGHYPVDQYFHYGLALDFYTHFTSPIRRYADVVAHRQLLMCVNDEVALADCGTKISSMTQDNKVSEICDNLNLKSRESKFAQRDSTELFQSLYVLQNTADGPLIETGVIAEIRSNGFFVFIPRFGLKGPVFLVGRDGKTTVPLSLQSGNSEHDEEYLPNCDIQVDMPTAITVTAATLPKPIVFSLFDHVRVSLKLRKSHAHRHMVYMTLIDLQSSELPSKKMTSNEMMQSIITNNSVSTGQQPMPNTTTMSKQEIEARRELKKSTKHQGTMYELLEQFRKISITENTSN
ncbi:dis3-like exonuclease 1 [Lichtheimia corymbifera JMRC:FSU:9682]|uniref:DIS3-like exonuclease 1 n=1 Tax=Lichtheimia corymbifera JMRC:FSU:9682 TaxID=1263082 RepID=A0A068RN35_9FUNG|nr:dis3-like exonuclease 1 [Lichtheimia corymbifera JMRC:FSU:9682]